MQNYSGSPNPPGGYGATPPPPPRKGISKGCIIAIVAAVLLGGVVVVLITAGVGGALWLSRQANQQSGAFNTNSSGTTSSGATTRGGGDDAGVEGPQPTEAQAAAVAGGQTASWPQQEMSWTVPQRWRQHSAESTSLLWRSPGTWDAASLIVNVSPMGADFPTEVSINAFYQQAQTRKQNGEVNEVRWLKLDGVKGVMFRESAPESSDDPQRLQWLGYRNYKGQVQMLNVMLASRGKDFARHEDALYGILYSTKLSP